MTKDLVSAFRPATSNAVPLIASASKIPAISPASGHIASARGMCSSKTHRKIINAAKSAATRVARGITTPTPLPERVGAARMTNCCPSRRSSFPANFPTTIPLPDDLNMPFCCRSSMLAKRAAP